MIIEGPTVYGCKNKHTTQMILFPFSAADPPYGCANSGHCDRKQYDWNNDRLLIRHHCVVAMLHSFVVGRLGVRGGGVQINLQVLKET